MNVPFITRGTGKRRALTQTEANARIAELEQQLATVTAENNQLLYAVGRAAITAKRLDDANKRIIRQAADIARLRQTVINTRPRITVAPAALDRPYVAAVPVPYPVPVGRSTANEQTQPLPLLELPAATAA